MKNYFNSQTNRAQLLLTFKFRMVKKKKEFRRNKYNLEKYRYLNSINHSSCEICGSSAIQCDGCRLLGCDAVDTCKHSSSLANNFSTSTVGL